MPRPRTLDPSNLPLEPNPTTDPARAEELVEDLKDRLAYLRRSFLIGRETLANDKVAFNDSLRRLRRSLARKRKANHRGKRLHPEVEIVITHHARTLAEDEGVEVGQNHVELAGHKALEVLKPRRGRGDDKLLDHHVAGLVALIQQYTGLPVLAYRTRNSVYEPHFAEGMSSAVPLIMQEWDPEITVTRQVNCVLKTRREYAGKPLRFLDLFPFYGAKAEEDGQIELKQGHRLERFEANIPIYCP